MPIIILSIFDGAWLSQPSLQNTVFWSEKTVFCIFLLSSLFVIASCKPTKWVPDNYLSDRNVSSPISLSRINWCPGSFHGKSTYNVAVETVERGTFPFSTILHKKYLWHIYLLLLSKIAPFTSSWLTYTTWTILTNNCSKLASATVHVYNFPTTQRVSIR